MPWMSTFWPATKWSAVISAPTSIRSSSVDAEFGDDALGLDLSLGEVAAHGLGGVLGLLGAGAELEGDVAVLLLGALADDLAAVEATARSPARGCPASSKKRVMPSFLAITPVRIGSGLPYSLISTSTPADRSSFISASTVCGVGSTISSTRLCVRISNCSRDFLSTCGERLTVNFSMQGRQRDRAADGRAGALGRLARSRAWNGPARGDRRP